MNFIKKILIGSAAMIGAVVLPGTVASAASLHPETCSYYSTGRITCRYSTGGGSYSYNSYNPRTGYSSYGYRSVTGSSSYGTRSYSSSSSYGYRSYNSYGLGTGSIGRSSYGWNSASGYGSSLSSYNTRGSIGSTYLGSSGLGSSCIFLWDC